MNTREQRRLAVTLGRVAALRELKARSESARAHHAVHAKERERDALVQAQAEAEAEVLRADTPLPAPRPVTSRARPHAHPNTRRAPGASAEAPVVSGALFQLVADSRQTFRQERARVDQDLAQRQAAAQARDEAHVLAMRRRATRDRVAEKVTRQWRFETNRALDRTLTDESAARRVAGTL